MLKSRFTIGGQAVSEHDKPYIIAEIGSNHDQSLETAFKLIDVAAEAGAHAAKFQLFKADKMYPAGTKLHEIFTSIELNVEWVPKLAEYCGKAGVHFLASPFDRQSADILDEAGVPAFKIASSETAKTGLLAHIAAFRKPMIISTGMSDMVDVHDAVQVCLRAGNDQVALLQCGAMYPIPPEHVNLKVLNTFSGLYGCPVGFSDHAVGATAAIASIGCGASVIEKHITLDRESKGPDHFFAMEPAELIAYVAAINEAYACMGDPEKRMLQWERDRSRRDGLYAARDIAEGEEIGAEDIRIQRPAGAIRKRHYLTVRGSRTKRAYKENESFDWDGLELFD